MEMSSNGMYVLTGEETNKLTLWQEGTKVWDKGGFLAGLYGIDISSDGSNITAVDRRNVYFFDKGSNSEVWNENFANLYFHYFVHAWCLCSISLSNILSM